MKSKKTKVLVIILCLTMVYMTTVYATTGFSEDITQTNSIFTLPSNSVKGLLSECVIYGNSIYQSVKNGNIANASEFTGVNSSLSADSNILSITGTGGSS